MKIHKVDINVISDVPKTSGIYVITSKRKGWQYVGCSVNMYDRLKVHKMRLRKNIHNNSILQNHVNKYGFEDFEFGIIEYCMGESCLLASREQYWVNKLRPRFNIKRQVVDSALGVRFTKEQKAEMSEKKRKTRGDKYKGENSAMFGRKLSLATRKKMSESHKGDKAPWFGKSGEDHNMYGKKHYLYDHTIYIFQHEIHGEIECTQHDLRIKYNIPGNSISALCKEKRRNLEGWTLKNAKPRKESHMKGKKVGEKEAERLRELNKGRCFPNRNKPSVPSVLKGRELSEEHKEKIRLSWIKRKQKKEELCLLSQCRS